MAVSNFTVTPTWVHPIQELYSSIITASENFKKEYFLLSTTPNRRFKLTITGVTDTTFNNSVLAQWRSTSGTYAAFHWTSVPTYINGGGGAGVSMYGRWVSREFIPKKNTWNVELVFKKEIPTAVPEFLLLAENGDELITEDSKNIIGEW